ncbi:lytic murein transglycosylase [Vibrio azureus]|nr:lytic transglycosylase domain-containing protein [Vibrio azureus]AUI88615.1 lytic murein transglycosylase [Vibrio azureus]
MMLLLSSALCSSAVARPSDSAIKQQHQILARHKTHISKRFETSHQLVNHILQQLKHRSLPADLVLLPMLESSFNPKAVSHANAAGLWQLIPATARRFGLQVTSQRDQRFDVKASTQAALAYLTFLYKKFDQDIALTLAAYNAGEGRVARAIKRAGSRDFSKLILPQETQQYVHRFFALSQLINVKQMHSTTVQPLMLFSTQETFTFEPLVDWAPLPPLVSL